jgi:hypothetical protein
VSFWRKRERHRDQPDVDGARAELAKVRARRSEVDALVDALVRERRLNNFTANVVVTFRGGRS